MARGLLEDDHERRICLEEAIAMQPGIACHQLLAVILLTDEVAEPHLLWDQFKAGLFDDVKHKLYYMNHYQANQEIPEDDVYDYDLWDLNRILVVSQLCHGPVVTYCMVYHYTKRATLARLLANEGPAIYVIHFEQVFCYTSMILFSSHFL